MVFKKTNISIFTQTNKLVLLLILSEISLADLVPYTTNEYLPILNL